MFQIQLFFIVVKSEVAAPWRTLQGVASVLPGLYHVAACCGCVKAASVITTTCHMAVVSCVKYAGVTARHHAMKEQGLKYELEDVAQNHRKLRSENVIGDDLVQAYC